MCQARSGHRCSRRDVPPLVPAGWYVLMPISSARCVCAPRETLPSTLIRPNIAATCTFINATARTSGLDFFPVATSCGESACREQTVIRVLVPVLRIASIHGILICWNTANYEKSLKSLGQYRRHLHSAGRPYRVRPTLSHAASDADSPSLQRNRESDYWKLPMRTNGAQ